MPKSAAAAAPEPAKFGDRVERRCGTLGSGEAGRCSSPRSLLGCCSGTGRRIQARLLHPLRERARAARGADRVRSDHISEAKFYIHIVVSIQRILIGFALATALGICLGVVMGRSRIARDMVTPYIEILRPIPAVAWIPLAILMWPTEESSIIYITFLGALFPIVLNTVHGVEQTPEVLVRAAQIARRLAAAHLLARRDAGGAAVICHRASPSAWACPGFRCWPARSSAASTASATSPGTPIR